MLTVFRVGINFFLAASPSLDSDLSTHSKPLCICVRRLRRLKSIIRFSFLQVDKAHPKWPFYTSGNFGNSYLVM